MEWNTTRAQIKHNEQTRSGSSNARGMERASTRKKEGSHSVFGRHTYTGEKRTNERVLGLLLVSDDDDGVEMN